MQRKGNAEMATPGAEEFRYRIDWDVIESFVGYGNPQAEVVFVGMEEGLDPSEDLLAELELRSTYPPVIAVSRLSPLRLTCVSAGVKLTHPAG